MARRLGVVAVLLLLLVPASGWGAEDGLGGTWRVEVLLQGQRPTLWLVRLESKEGNWAGTVVAASQGFPKATLSDVRVDGDHVFFAINVNNQAWIFDGKLDQGRREVRGSLERPGAPMTLALLEPTRLKTLDPFELNKEIIAKPASDLEIFQAADNLLQQAGSQKATPEEVKGWADKAFTTAQRYGPRWQREVALRAAERLAGQAGFVPVAAEHAQRAVQLLKPDTDADAQVQTLTVAASVLKKAGKAEEARALQARLPKLEQQAYEQYAAKMMPFKPGPSAGRKAKSGHAVLVELFTGAQCPPCVAADVGFDALEQTFKPTDVILLQYHLHIPRPDALTNPATEARQRYYGSSVQGTPTIFFDGGSGTGVNPGGGSLAGAEGKYKEYQGAVAALLEKPAKANLQATARRKGGKIDLSVTASVEEASDDLRLRLALVEERVRYAGSNGLKYHHQVVRAMPGGEDGVPLKGKQLKHAATVDLDELRKNLNAYLEEHHFPEEPRPLALQHLRVVAFVQNDASKEVLQAVQLEVPTEGEKGQE